VLVDGGNLGNEPSKQPVIVGAFVKMGYAACLTEAAKADSVRKEVGKATLAVVPPFDPTHADRTCWIGELDGVQVAFLRLEPPGQPDPGAWESALVSSLRALRKHADLMVLTSRLNDADNRRLAHRLGPTGLAQVMFVAPGNCTPDLPAEVDGVLLCPTKDRGQAVTLVVATRAARAPWKAWCRLEPVSSTYTPDRGVPILRIATDSARRRNRREPTERSRLRVGAAVQTVPRRGVRSMAEERPRSGRRHASRQAAAGAGVPHLP